MKSTVIIVAMFIIALTIFAGCQGGKPAEQPATPEQAASNDKTPAATQPEEKPPETTPETPAETPKPVDLPPLEITPVQPNDPPVRATKLAFAKMELGMSKTFGVIYRDWMMALYARDYDKAWALLSANAQAQMDLERNHALQTLQLASQAAQVMARRADSPAQAAQFQRNIVMWDAQAAEIQKLDAKQFLAWICRHYETNTGNNPITPYITEIHKFTGEQIDGDKGTVTTDAKEPDNKLTFARENGEWKIDCVPLTGIHKNVNVPAPNP